MVFSKTSPCGRGGRAELEVASLCVFRRFFSHERAFSSVALRLPGGSERSGCCAHCRARWGAEKCFSVFHFLRNLRLAAWPRRLRTVDIIRSKVDEGIRMSLFVDWQIQYALRENGEIRCMLERCSQDSVNDVRVAAYGPGPRLHGAVWRELHRTESV